MRRAIRKGVDISTGHCYSPRPCITGSENVLINNIPVCRAGDYYPNHCCGSSCHDGVATSTSNVFVNNRPLHPTKEFGRFEYDKNTGVVTFF